MQKATLEHVNITVSNPAATAQMLCDIFGWKVRWKGDAIHGGTTYHVGNDDDYLAIYSDGKPTEREEQSYKRVAGLNHVGIVVEDLHAIEEKILSKGYETFSHADYEPGKRFYFRDSDNIEFEVVSYAQ